MITRIVLLQPKVSPPGDGTISHGIDVSINSVVGLESIQRTIPGVITIQSGRRFNNPNHEFEYAIVVRFVDSKSINAFESHERVQQIFASLSELCDKIIEIDLPDFTLALPPGFQFPNEPSLNPLVKEMVAQTLNHTDSLLVTWGASLWSELNMTWVHAISLHSNLTDFFQIQISDDDFGELLTVGDIQTYLEKRGVL